MNSPASTKNPLEAVTRNIQATRAAVLRPAERYLAGMASLPPAPTLVTELLKLFQQPDSDIDQVVQLISY
jgi:HD-like signal output (HDOD) protein